ncbi:hypothetical protein TanjilG_10226 [Lupinus angustifolius]|uniref:Uncharacterized protein n=1 Tax=Lupinus angustifolius TaxID=3871 RepID=A0A4P1RBZ6_LUPAN|nr:PREDICTED: uncharacterized protein LOC109354373 [Lupinus angustifolius]OIW07391.1 hypothetical protein TanjilG_10226 [Lupinus angustifolius]
MPTLHKFKLLATQCAVSGSPTRSPTASPVIHLRRRKTLRMFLSRRSDDPPQIHQNDVVRVRNKLKDLFVSSPSPPTPPSPLQDDDKSYRQQQQQQQEEQEILLPRFRSGSPFRRGGATSLRPVSSAFRYRLIRRAWRPMLLTIPE